MSSAKSVQVVKGPAIRRVPSDCLNDITKEKVEGDKERAKRERGRRTRILIALGLGACHAIIVGALLFNAWCAYSPTLLPIAHPGELRGAMSVVVGGISHTAFLYLCAWAYGAALPAFILSERQRSTILAANVMFFVYLIYRDGAYSH
jgi:hypothetical protein